MFNLISFFLLLLCSLQTIAPATAIAPLSFHPLSGNAVATGSNSIADTTYPNTYPLTFSNGLGGVLYTSDTCVLSSSNGCSLNFTITNTANAGTALFAGVTFHSGVQTAAGGDFIQYGIVFNSAGINLWYMLGATTYSHNGQHLDAYNSAIQGIDTSQNSYPFTSATVFSMIISGTSIVYYADNVILAIHNYAGSSTAVLNSYFGFGSPASIYQIALTSTSVQPTLFPITPSPTVAGSTTVVCSSYPQGNLQDCYNKRLNCHYDPDLDDCTNNAPATCGQYLSDSVGCGMNSTQCTFNTIYQYCNDVPASCTTVTDVTSCQQRSDCNWNSTSTTCGSHAGICKSLYSQNSCQNYNCFWDPYVTYSNSGAYALGSGACASSLADMTGAYGCGTWSNSGTPNQACTFHGCSLDASGQICTNAGTGVSTSAAAAGNYQVQYVAPGVANNSLTFSVQVWTPNVLSYYLAQWTYISIGAANSGYSTTPNFFAPNPTCNNIASYSNSTTPPYYTAVSNPASMQSYFNNFVQTNHTLNFPPTDTYAPQLQQIMGPLNIGPGNFDSSVNLDSTTNWLVHTATIDANVCVKNCSCSVLSTGKARYYTIPLLVTFRDYQNNYVQVNSAFYIHLAETGTIAIGASSQYVPVLYRSELTSISNACPAGSALLSTVYMLSIQNVYNTKIFVGPRTIADVMFTSPALNYTLNNCYGEYVYSLTKLGCALGTCYTQITTRTKCRVLTNDGLAFNNCSYSNAADRMADVESGSYNASLNGLHTFFVNDYSCPLTANANNLWAGCSTANSSPYGFPDVMKSSVFVTLYPTTILNVQFDVFAGLLPSPTTTDLSTIQLLSTAGNVVTTGISTFNQQLQWNGVLTYIVGMVAASLRPLVTLSITLDAGFQIYPLDAYGKIIPTGRVLYFGQLFPYMTYVPSNAAPLCLLPAGSVGVSSPCPTLPGLFNYSGYDGFSIPVQTLRALSPASGYGIQVNYFYTEAMPATPSPNGVQNMKDNHLMSVHSQHLFGVMDTKKPKMKVMAAGITPTSGQFTFNFEINDDSNPIPPVIAGPDTSVVLNSQETVLGEQVLLRVYVDSDAQYSPQGIADLTNTTQLVAYTASVVASVISRTLAIDAAQVIYIKVQAEKPSFGISSNHARNLKSVISPLLYVSFVVVPASVNSTTTATLLVGSLIGASLPLLKVNLRKNYLVLDVANSPSRIHVLIPVRDFSAVNDASPAQVVTSSSTSSSTSVSGDSSMMTAPVIGGGVAGVIFILVICMWLGVEVSRSKNGVAYGTLPTK